METMTVFASLSARHMMMMAYWDPWQCCGVHTLCCSSSCVVCRTRLRHLSCPCEVKAIQQLINESGNEDSTFSVVSFLLSPQWRMAVMDLTNMTMATNLTVANRHGSGYQTWQWLPNMTVANKPDSGYQTWQWLTNLTVATKHGSGHVSKSLSRLALKNNWPGLL